MSRRRTGVSVTKVPSNRTDEIEIDNEAPCHSLGLERSRGVEELELYEEHEHEKKGKNVPGVGRCTPTLNICVSPQSGWQVKKRKIEHVRLRVVLLPLSLCPRRRILTSGLFFLSSARSARSCSSIESLTRFASCSARMRASRWAGVSPGGGRRTASKGSARWFWGTDFAATMVGGAKGRSGRRKDGIHPNRPFFLSAVLPSLETVSPNRVNRETVTTMDHT